MRLIKDPLCSINTSPPLSPHTAIMTRLLSWNPFYCAGVGVTASSPCRLKQGQGRIIKHVPRSTDRRGLHCHLQKDNQPTGGFNRKHVHWTVTHSAPHRTQAGVDGFPSVNDKLISSVSRGEVLLLSPWRGCILHGTYLESTTGYDIILPGITLQRGIQTKA